jgi:hypothetical protein
MRVRAAATLAAALGIGVLGPAAPADGSPPLSTGAGLSTGAAAQHGGRDHGGGDQSGDHRDGDHSRDNHGRHHRGDHGHGGREYSGREDSGHGHGGREDSSRDRGRGQERGDGWRRDSGRSRVQNQRAQNQTGAKRQTPVGGQRTRATGSAKGIGPRVGGRATIARAAVVTPVKRQPAATARAVATRAHPAEGPATKALTTTPTPQASPEAAPDLTASAAGGTGAGVVAATAAAVLAMLVAAGFSARRRIGQVS